MPKALKAMLDNGFARDEPDRMPEKIHVSVLDIFMYVVAIVGHLVDLGVDINVAVRYFLAQKTTEFGWTLAFILIPAFVNTAVSTRINVSQLSIAFWQWPPPVVFIASCLEQLSSIWVPQYAQDKQQLDSLSNEFTRKKWLRVFILVLQMAPVMRFADALIYAIKSRQAERNKDPSAQRQYYGLMLKEDADAALLRVFECFLEAAPQHVLQTALLLRTGREFAFHQTLSIASSVIGLGWCLGAYQRAIRFAQDKDNMTWLGTSLQTLYHFLISLSRIISIAAIAYLFPHWTVLACIIHIMVMATLIQIFDRSPFCAHNKLAEFAFSVALGAVYLFTYILPVEGRTRYRYTLYYSLCFVQNFVCGALWWYYVDDNVRQTVYFFPVLLITVVPFLVGICIMIVYYSFFHPKRKEIGFSISFKASEEISLSN